MNKIDYKKVEPDKEEKKYKEVDVEQNGWSYRWNDDEGHVLSDDRGIEVLGDGGDIDGEDIYLMVGSHHTVKFPMDALPPDICQALIEQFQDEPPEGEE